MAKANGDNVARLIPSPSVAKSPDSDVSPGTQAPSVPADYFLVKSGLDDDRKPGGAFVQQPFVPVPASTDASTTATQASNSSSRQSSNDNGRLQGESRKSSSASVTFRPPRNPSLPQGHPRKTDNRRLRDSSPSPVR